MGTLKVQDPPGSGNWVPIVSGGAAGGGTVAYRDTLDSTYVTTATSGATAVQVPGLGVTVNVLDGSQVWLVEMSAYASTPAGCVVILDLTIDGGAVDASKGSLVAQSGTGGGTQTPAKVFTVTGLSPGLHTFGMKAWHQAGACTLGATSTAITAWSSSGAVPGTDVPDWGAYTNDQASPGAATITGTAVKLPFATAQFKGVGVKPDGASGLQVTKAGIYRLQADITINSSNAGWIIGEIRVFRAGAQFRVFSIVSGNNTTGGFAEWTIHALTDLLAGDIAYVYATTSAVGTNSFDSRSQFTCHQIATTSAASGELTAGYRGITAQSIPNAALTTVSLEATPDHTCGGVSIASNIVTITTAGIYQLQGSVQFNSMAAARVILRIEGWSGADPAVGSGTILAENDVSNVAGNYPGLTAVTQMFLPAGYRLRLITYQASTVAAPLVGGGEPAKLNIRKISQGGQPQDTGWLLPGSGGGTFAAGWGQFNAGYEQFVLKRIGNTVIGQGLVTRSSGSGTTILTLPAGFWPSRATVRLSRSNATPDSIFIDNTTGNIIVSNTVVPVNGQPYLVEFTYDINQP